jgi:hypothetical protein
MALLDIINADDEPSRELRIEVPVVDRQASGDCLAYNATLQTRSGPLTVSGCGRIDKDWIASFRTRRKDRQRRSK